MAKDDINKPTNPPAQELGTNANPVETAVESAEPMERAPGFHVINKATGQSLGCYPSDNDAKAFGDGHLTPQGIEFEIEEVG